MAKVTSLLGGLRGKASNMVFAKTGGEVIMREYNPVVANPNTASQVSVRTKFKLMSQLAAAMADVIVIPKNGLVSARNRFMSINMPLAYEVNGVAQVSYENLQLTDGNLGLPGIKVSRTGDNGGYIELTEAAGASMSRVVYAVFRKSSEEILQLLFTAIVSIPGDDQKFRVEGLTLEGELVIFAYGMRDLNAAATARYGNYSVANGEDLARLISQRSLSAADYKFTKTRGTTLLLGADDSETVPANMARVFVTATNGGSVAGAGTFEVGSNVTVTATPNENYEFKGWRNNGATGTAFVSTAASYTFILNGQTDLVAVFEEVGGEPVMP